MPSSQWYRSHACDLYHRELGKGVSRAVATMTPIDDLDDVHFRVCNIFTLPPHPGLPSE